jgi:hypothetical protein
MYAKDLITVVDRREMLKIKLKSLAAEARIIRLQEQRSWGVLRESMHLHRVFQVRAAARQTHIAYGLIRGYSLARIEPKASRPYNVDAVQKMIKTYGPVDATANARLCEIAAQGADVCIGRAIEQRLAA